MTSTADPQWIIQRWMRRATYASVTVSILLIALKAYAYLVSDSLAMLASLLDSSLDSLSSILNLLAIRHATTPPDSDHRYGHEKAEPLAGLAQAAFILGSSGFLVIEAVQHLITPAPLSDDLTGVWVSLLAIILTAGLLAFQAFVIRISGSMVVTADALHYRADLLTNFAVLISVLATAHLKLPALDAAVGMGIAFVIAHSAIQLFRQAYDQLMDREVPGEIAADVEKIAREHENVRDVHDIRTRMAGSRLFIQMHLELDPEITLMRAHIISDNVESRIRLAFPGCDILIHQDPAGYEMPATA